MVRLVVCKKTPKWKHSMTNKSLLIPKTAPRCDPPARVLEQLDVSVTDDVRSWTRPVVAFCKTEKKGQLIKWIGGLQGQSTYTCQVFRALQSTTNLAVHCVQIQVDQEWLYLWRWANLQQYRGVKTGNAQAMQKACRIAAFRKFIPMQGSEEVDRM
jgi:hypothetical protein